MQALLVTIPVTTAHERGDYADLYVNDAQINKSPIEFFPGSSPVEAGEITVATHELYYGDHAVRVETRDALGNLAPEGGITKNLLVDTGPTAPKNLDFDHGDSASVTFTFTPSPELQTP